jgi:hypothetical protein
MINGPAEPLLGMAQWADADGSRVVARVVQKVDAPPPSDPTKDVQWLKAETLQDPQDGNFGTGVFSEVTFIQRVLTYGGQATPSDHGTTVSVPYATLYVFWAAAK